jgi:hypothetical protein
MRCTMYCRKFLAAAAIVFGAGTARVSAEKIIDFEDVALSANSYYIGADSAGGFSSGGVFFPNSYNSTYDSWGGWGASSLTETSPPDPDNFYSSVFHVRECSAIAGGGRNGSANYAVAYNADIFAQPPRCELVFPQPLELAQVYLTNTNYAYYMMHDGAPVGSGFVGKKFGGESGNDPDYFFVTIAGKDATGATTGSLDFYLADYRNLQGEPDYILHDWTAVDLHGLGANVQSLEFTWYSSDNDPQWGMNTPAYFALDDLTVVPEPGMLPLMATAALLGLLAYGKKSRL